MRKPPGGRGGAGRSPLAGHHGAEVASQGRGPAAERLPHRDAHAAHDAHHEDHDEADGEREVGGLPPPFAPPPTLEAGRRVVGIHFLIDHRGGGSFPKFQKPVTHDPLGDQLVIQGLPPFSNFWPIVTISRFTQI